MFDDDALTAEEVAEMLRVSKNSVYRLAQSGELASYRVGRKLRFTLRDVEAYTRAGMPVVVIRLLKRKQGFIVQAGNPKKLTTWGGLLREGVRLVNRERGCGTRVLLDEKLLSLEARPEMVEGYDLECSTGLEAATLVSKGCADVAIGVERLAKELPGLAFVPLQTEWLDIAVEKSQRTAPLVREIRKIAESESFRGAIDAIEGYEAANTGAIVYES